jgi:pilus assembly protein CpaE
MPIHIALYYHSPDRAGYLQQVIDSAGHDSLVDSQSLEPLPPPVNTGADVVLLEYRENNPDLDRWIEQTTSNPQSPPVFLYFQEISTAGLWKALRLGVKECFAYPLKGEEFQAAVQRAVARATLSLAQGDAPRIVALMGCKGGVGATFLTANLAYILARGRKRKVLAMDLDLRYGQLSYLFNLQPRHTIIDLPENLDQLDNASLLTLLHPYDQYLHLLPAPRRLEEAETVTPQQVEKILRHLKEHRIFSWILLDCCHHLDDVTLKALEVADDLVLVTTPSLPALSNARKLLEVLKLLKLGGRTEVWLNALQRESDLSLPDITKFLAYEVSGTVPWDIQAVGRSIDAGRPLAETAHRHPISLDLKALAARLAGESQEDTNGSRWGWLKRLRKKG